MQKSRDVREKRRKRDIGERTAFDTQDPILQLFTNQLLSWGYPVHNFFFFLLHIRTM